MASEVVQSVKMLAVSPYGLSSNPGTHMVEVENWVAKLFTDLHKDTLKLVFSTPPHRIKILDDTVKLEITLNEINHRLRGRANNQLIGSNHRVSGEVGRSEKDLAFRSMAMIWWPWSVTPKDKNWRCYRMKKRAWDPMTLSHPQTKEHLHNSISTHTININPLIDGFIHPSLPSWILKKHGLV